MNLQVKTLLETRSVEVFNVRIGGRENLTARLVNEGSALSLEIGADKQYVRVIVDRDEAVRVEQIDGIERRYLQRDTAGDLRFLKGRPHKWTGREQAALPTGLSMLLGEEPLPAAANQ